MKPLLGGKGVPIWQEMTRIDCSCLRIYHHHRGLHLFLRQRLTYPAAPQAQMEAGVATEKDILGKKFGDM